MSDSTATCHDPTCGEPTSSEGMYCRTHKGDPAARQRRKRQRDRDDQLTTLVDAAGDPCRAGQALADQLQTFRELVHPLMVSLKVIGPALETLGDVEGMEAALDEAHERVAEVERRAKAQISDLEDMVSGLVDEREVLLHQLRNARRDDNEEEVRDDRDPRGELIAVLRDDRDATRSELADVQRQLDELHRRSAAQALRLTKAALSQRVTAAEERADRAEAELTRLRLQRGDAPSSPDGEP